MENVRPNLPKRLFWEFKYADIDWLKEYASVIERVIERGTESEWNQLIRFYGKDKVVNTLKNETNYLPVEIIDDVCKYFNLSKTQLKCYTRRQSLP
jgi:hypothetical protein